jgi:hypothetical protein
VIIFGLLLVAGFFRSLQFTSLNTLGYCDVDRARMSTATSFAATAQQVAQAIGVAVGAAALEASKALSGRAALALGDFRNAFLFVAVVCAISSVMFLKLPRDAGALVSGRRESPGPESTIDEAPAAAAE